MMAGRFVQCFVIAVTLAGSSPRASTPLRGTTPFITAGAFVAFTGPAGRAQIATERSFAFAHVNVVDVERGVVRDDQTVVVAGNRVAQVGPADRVTTPPGAQVIGVRGKFLIPGLWDMHAHGPFSADLFVLHAAHGVTGIRHMAGPLTEATAFRSARPDALREYPMRIRVGAMSGPGLDSFESYPQFPGHWLPATSPEEARRGVAAVRAAHLDFVKIHTQMTGDTWRAAVAEARKLGIPFAGHVPYAVSPAEAADAGQKSIEHLTGVLIACSSEEDEIRRSLAPLPPSAAKTAPRVEAATGSRALATFSQEKCEALARRFARARTWQVPTFVATDPDRCCVRAADDPRARYLPDAARQWWEGAAPAAAPDADRVTPRRMLQKRLEIVGMFHRFGVPLLAGTDAPIPWVYPGLSLHDELAWLVRAGLAPAEALRTATSNPARFLDRTGDFGSVARGKLADLVLLDANPLRDIANTRTVRAVVLDGELFDQAAILKWLEFVADRAKRTMP
jgi:imidazolonepropionase-like amidohydrolase